MSDAPSKFSAHNPLLQLAWDATSFYSLMFCPRKYYYEIIQGWRGSTVDLDFGVMYAKAMETFYKARLDGKSRDEAQLEAARTALEESGQYAGDEQEWVPWGGRYEAQWRCTGTEKYKNEKGNPAKCPFSHKGKWQEGPAPPICGECGSETEEAVNWLPGHNVKHRYTLLQTVIWACEEQPDDDVSGIQPYKFEDGTKAVELPFRLFLPYKTPAGESYILCGYLDGIVTFGNEAFTADDKTTGSYIGKAYYSGFNPNIQFDIYDLAGSLLYPNLHLGGVAVRAAQVQQSGSKFGFDISRRTERQREELLDELGWWLKLAEEFAESGKYPMNRANCRFCGFRGICSKDPTQRQRYLEADFKVKHWNPLEER